MATVLTFLIGMKRFLPHIIIGLGVIALVWFGINRWNEYKVELIAEGYANATADFREQIKQQNERNREMERLHAEQVADWNRTREILAQRRVDKEREVITRIENNLTNPVFSNPDCVIPDDVLASRNQIRALGPEEVN